MRTDVKGLSVALLAMLFASAFPRAGRAEPGSVEVHLAHGASGCPDPDAVRARLLAALPHGPPEGMAIAVSFSRQGHGYEATISLTPSATAAGQSGGTRTIKHPKASCGAMIDAVGATLSLMLDPFESVRPSEPEPPPPPPPKEEEPPAVPSPPAPAPFVTFGLGAGITRSSFDRVAPEIDLSARWVRPRPWSFGLGLFYQPRQRRDALATQAGPPLVTAPGSVSVMVAGGALDGCFELLGRDASEAHMGLAIDVCGAFRLAAVAGTADGYPRQGSDVKPLLTLGGGPLGTLSLTRNFGLWLRASADVPLVRASYAVDGVGMVYNGENIFFSLSMGASVSLP